MDHRVAKKNIPSEPVGAAPKNPRRWYAIHTYSGYEDAVARYLNQRVESLMMTDKIFSVVVPKEVKIKVRSGKRYTIEEKIYPGYVLVEMILDHDSWAVVRNTPRVTGFVGTDPAVPAPLSDEEIAELLGRMGERETKFKVDLKVNDLVRIADGPFKDQEGKVSEVDEGHGKVKVLVPVFGRDTLLELDSLQVQKI
ncbi:MAG: transcription termination/antitermination factor NusG [Candidatus Brennerbacteria bacterium]|nr:transcription termination/antitermination factor NusG [Candidatus Brennerbacteria bacterium]